MKTSQIKVFEELLNDPDFKEKEMLKYLLWKNTVKPQFQKGDCFKVTDRSRKIFGYPVIGVKAKVTKRYTYKEKCEWFYELEMEVRCGNESAVVTDYVSEEELLQAKRCEDNRNVLGNAKSKFADSITV